MRPLVPVTLTALLAMTALGGCAAGAAEWTAPPLENFDPSQVRMLPDNPYQTARPAEAAGAAKR